MTTRYTQDEWLAIFDQAGQNPPSTPLGYNAPSVGTAAFAKTIDHTLLKLDATEKQVDTLCKEARRLNFKSVCVRLTWVDRAVHNLQGGSVVVACVVGFHEGTQSLKQKTTEAARAVDAGAEELDMVMNYVLLRQKQYSKVYTEIAAVRNVAPHPVILKVILETSQLSPREIIAGCKIAEAAGADYVKTSTGFNGQGATQENIRLMRSVVGDNMKVKASGGVKTINECVVMMEAGAERIGTSNGVWIMEEAKSLLEQVTHAAGSGEPKGQRPAASLTRMFSSS
ncbi:MAG: hypothetical protein ALECFALPRED_003203 [Alectoria fallacina]|uniref:deoxyribose-phosphate aldolase n=1 Tax=Alectoria fallacina TaxID=1903189 RepID=A0A8H3FLR3_9LECA|nr:MAG: hypothetical protein ALECFALPRED_003203 [Alectoria fallacina]